MGTHILNLGATSLNVPQEYLLAVLIALAAFGVCAVFAD